MWASIIQKRKERLEQLEAGDESLLLQEASSDISGSSGVSGDEEGGAGGGVGLGGTMADEGEVGGLSEGALALADQIAGDVGGGVEGQGSDVAGEGGKGRDAAGDVGMGA